jgi:hypothetical protein
MSPERAKYKPERSSHSRPWSTVSNTLSDLYRTNENELTLALVTHSDIVRSIWTEGLSTGWEDSFKGLEGEGGEDWDGLDSRFSAVRKCNGDSEREKIIEIARFDHFAICNDNLSKS